MWEILPTQFFFVNDFANLFGNHCYVCLRSVLKIFILVVCKLSSIEIMRCYGEKKILINQQLSIRKRFSISCSRFDFGGPIKNIGLRTSHKSTFTITLIQFWMKNTCERRITNNCFTSKKRFLDYWHVSTSHSFIISIF